MFYLTLLKTSLKASTAKRGAFLIEMSIMAANNLIFLSLWWIFFRQYNDIGGWQMDDMILLMTVGIGGYGLFQVCFGGIRSLSRMILNGDIDPYLTQPKNVLLHIAGSRSHSKGWGHILTSVILMIYGKAVSLALVFLGMFCSALVFASMSTIAHSLPFWLGSVEGLSKKYCDSLFLFALYPTNIYSGVLQLVMFTVIPAGVIGYLPVELIREFSWGNFVLLILSSFGFVALALTTFYAGLRKYESGNTFGFRA